MKFLVLTLLATAYAMPPGSRYYTSTPEPVRVAPYFVPAAAPEIPPIDANDVIYSKDFWVNPSARHIVYNFEHIRRDQPAHVENREEDVGAYIYRRPSTTHRPKINLHPTQVPLLNQPAVEELARPVEQVPEWSQLLADEQPSFQQHPARFPVWTPEQAVPEQINVPTTQTPSTPRWEEYYYHQTSEPPHLSVTTAPLIASFSGVELTSAGQKSAPLDAVDWTHGNAQQKHRRPEARKITTKTSDLAPLDAVAWTRRNPTVQQTHLAHSKDEQQSLAPKKNAYSVVEQFSGSQDLAPIDAATWTRIRTSPVAQTTKPRSHGGRGQHKFSWDDLSGQTTDAPVPSVPMQNSLMPGGPSPPLPTLSPWSGDSFGK